MRVPFWTILSVLISFSLLNGQDMQYAQYYANPLYLNPALAGTGDDTRMMASQRTQWPKLPGKYISYAAGADHYMPNISSGVGVLISHDRIASARIASTGLGMMYNYNVSINNDWNFRPGIQLDVVHRNTDFSMLTFNEQYTVKGLIGSGHTENLGSHQNVNYIDISSGGLLYSQKVWLGASFHHLNRPNQSVLDGKSKLPIKLSLHGGIKIPLTPYNPDIGRRRSERELSLTPTFMYKAQGKFDQLDLGTYLYIEPILLGLWYRGLPLLKKNSDGSVNNAALVGMVGFKAKGFRFGYSYDIGLSSLGTGTGGAHEVSLMYEFSWAELRGDGFAGQPRSRKGEKTVKKLPNPIL